MATYNPTFLMTSADHCIISGEGEHLLTIKRLQNPIWNVMIISHTNKDITSQYRRWSISMHNVSISWSRFCTARILFNRGLGMSSATGFHIAKKSFLQDVQWSIRYFPTHWRRFAFLRYDQKRETTIFSKMKISLDFQMSVIIPSDLFYAYCDNSTKKQKAEIYLLPLPFY